VITDDLSTLFAPGPEAVRFRQGTITAWNPNTGANTVSVAGGILTDVPILNTGEAIALKAGHVVGLLAFGSTWFILGRITPTGDPNFAAASVDFGSAGAQVFNFATSTSMVVKASSNELVVPDWADEAIVHVTGGCCVVNNSAVITNVAMEVGCFGGVGGGLIQDIPIGRMGSVSASSRNLFTGLSGGEVLTVTGAAQAGAAFTAVGSNSMFVHATAVYKSNI